MQLLKSGPIDKVKFDFVPVSLWLTQQCFGRDDVTRQVKCDLWDNTIESTHGG